MNNYNKYKYLKERLDLNVDGYDLKNLIATDLISYIYSRKKESIIKKVTKRLFFIPDFLKQYYLNDTNNKKVLISKLINRKDYNEIIDLIDSNIKNSKIINTYATNYKLFFNIHNYIKSFRIIQKYYKNESLRIKFNIYLFICKALNIIKYMESNHNKIVIPEKFIAFNCAYLWDTYLVQFYKKRKVKTYSLNHGLTYAFKDKNKYIPLDVISHGENFTADYMLCWSEFVQNEMNSLDIAKSRLLLAGNLKYKKIDLSISNKFDNCIVFMARGLYRKNNIDLLNLIHKLNKIVNIKISVKFHPQNYSQEYIDICNDFGFEVIDKNITLLELYENEAYNFSIAYNTTAYYESFAKGLISFAYIDNDSEPCEVKENYFNCSEQLVDKLNVFKQKSNDELSDDINYFAKYILGASINNYKEILNGK